MTIMTELDAAIKAAQAKGVGLAAMTIRAGTPAWRALALPDADTASYEGVRVERTAEFGGWTLLT